MKLRRASVVAIACLSAGPLLAAGGSPRALKSAERAVSAGDARKAERQVRRSLRSPLAEVDLVRARVVLERAIRLRGTPDSSRLSTLALLGEVQVRTQRLADAEATYRTALAIAPRGSLVAASVRSDLAAVLACTGRLGEAITFQRLALAEAERAVDPKDQASLLPFVSRLSGLVRDPLEAELLKARAFELEALAREKARKSEMRERLAGYAPFTPFDHTVFREDSWTLYQEQQYQAATGIRSDH